MTSVAELWKGRDDSAEQGDTRRLFQIVRLNDATSCHDPAVLGFASDAGVKRNKGRIGAAGGPAAIRAMMAGLPAHQLQSFLDAGTVTCVDDALEEAQQALGDKVASLLPVHSRVVVLGGGHEIAWGSFQGLQRYLQAQEATRDEPPGSVLVVNMDAHFDLRTSRPANSGTPFDQIACACEAEGRDLTYACFGVSRLGNTPALFDRADRLHAFYVEDDHMQERFLQERLDELDRLIAAAHHVYFSVDLDVLPAAVAPGVSAPAPLGVPYLMIEAFARRIMQSGKCRLADIAEMNPAYDIDHHTARVAARLAWTLLVS